MYMIQRKRTCPPHIGKAADLMRLLGDPTRLEIFVRLSRVRPGLYVYEVAEALGISHSAASHQLATLEAYGAVVGEREGQHVRYFLADVPRARRALRVVRAALS